MTVSGGVTLTRHDSEPAAQKPCQSLRTLRGGRCRRRVGRRETGGKPDPRTRLDWAAHDRIVAGQGLCGRDRIRTCVGDAGDFTGRIAITSRVPSRPHMVPVIARDVHKQPVDSFSRPSGPPPVPRCPGRPGVGRSESGAKSLGSGQGRDRPQIIASAARLASDIAAPPVVAFAIAGARPRRRLKSSRGVGQIWSGDSLAKDPELFLACSSTRVVAILTETVKL
jgi:hypothetical protein